jgi:hypothetical protein
LSAAFNMDDGSMINHLYPPAQGAVGFRKFLIGDRNAVPANVTVHLIYHNLRNAQGADHKGLAEPPSPASTCI